MKKLLLLALISLPFSMSTWAAEHGEAAPKKEEAKSGHGEAAPKSEETSSTHGASAPAKKIAPRPTPVPTPEVKRNYTESEFKKAVMEEVERQMRRAGQAKLIDLSRELLEKEDKLKLRELEAQRQEEQFKMSTKQFQEKVKAFENSQNKFLGCVEDLEQKKNNRVKHMVEVVSGMKPDVAAQVLSVQEADISVEIISQLEPAKISKIFNLMDKEISARLQKQYMNMKK